MKDIKKIHILAVFITLITGITVQSCQEENFEQEYEYTYNSKKVNLKDFFTDKLMKSNMKKKVIYDTFLETTFETNTKIPENLNNDDLRKFVINNLTNIDGQIFYKMNGKVILKTIIKNGKITYKEVTEKKSKSKKDLTLKMLAKQQSCNSEEYPRACECSFEGIRQCANKSIYSMSTVEAIVCAFEFWPCYALESATCVENNCI